MDAFPVVAVNDETGEIVDVKMWGSYIDREAGLIHIEKGKILFENLKAPIHRVIFETGAGCFQLTVEQAIFPGESYELQIKKTGGSQSFARCERPAYTVNGKEAEMPRTGVR